MYLAGCDVDRLCGRRLGGTCKVGISQGGYSRYIYTLASVPDEQHVHSVRRYRRGEDRLQRRTAAGGVGSGAQWYNTHSEPPPYTQRGGGRGKEAVPSRVAKHAGNHVVHSEIPVASVY